MSRFAAGYFKLFKYIVSGGSAACVNLGVLYLLTEYAKLHYLQSAVLSFVCAFLVSFLLQKFWTFRDARKEVIHWQMIGFLGSSLVNLFLNTAIIFILVEYLHVWYLIAAFIAGTLLAVASFFVYHHLIFKESVAENPLA
jgi:putative flippase GtrA